jgi:hypothetical protein
MPTLPQATGELGQAGNPGSGQMQAAVTIGQFVKDQPAREMKALAHELLGDDPAEKAAELDCPCETAPSAEANCCG